MAVTPNSAIEQRRREIEKKRMAKRKKRRKAMLKRLFIFLCIAAVSVLAILSFTVFFPVEKITVDYNGSLYTDEQIIKASGIKKGENLWMTGSSAEENIPVKLPYIESADVTRKFPSSIVIKTKIAKAKFNFKVKNCIYICDKNYKVLEIKKIENKKLISVIGADIKKTKIGEKISFSNAKKQDTVDKIFSKLSEQSIKVNSLDVSELMDIKVRVDGRFDVQLGSMAHFDGKIAQLSQMIKNSEQENGGTIILSDYTPENRESILKK